VAITRAKHGLIVIGTHQVLSVDPTWGVFLDFCIRNDLYDGKVDILALAFARQAPMPMLERFLKHKASQAEPSLLGITGELEDDMWIRGATETLPDGEDEGDDSDVEGFYTGEDGFGSGAVLDNVKMFVG
jgi:helicase MOV-10